MSRRKYKFNNRQDAERAYSKADQQRLVTEWFASALLMGNCKQVGTWQGQRIGYFVTRHSAYVYLVDPKRAKQQGSPHCILGIWEVGSSELSHSIHEDAMYSSERAAYLRAAAAKAEVELYKPAESAN